MSRLGKYSLYLNLALAIFFAVWGFGLYTNRMDWKEESKNRGEQLRKLGSEISKLAPEVEATRGLAGVEDLRRPILDKWYADELQKLHSGKDKPKALVYNKGVLLTDPQKMPRLGEVVNSMNQPTNGVASLDVLDQEYAALQAEIGEIIAKQNKLVEEEKQLTIQLNGEGATSKGLRGEHADKLAAEQKSLERQEYVMPFLYNRQAELEILTKRRQGLDARLRELQGSNVAVPQ